MMVRFSPRSVAVTACLILHCWSARAADPTTADCLGASEASLKAGNEHKLRSERSQLLVCAASSCPADIRRECVRRVDEVNAAMPTLILQAKDSAGNDLNSVKVTMDGEILAERLEGTALSIDPGTHDFVFETPGQPPVRKQFVIRESEKDRREAIDFGIGVPKPSLPVSPPPANAANAAPTPPAADSGISPATQRYVGYGLGGAGVLFLGLAVYEQATALGRDSDGNRAAASSDPNVRNTAKPIHDQAKSAQTYAIVSGGVGLVALAAGIYFEIAASRAPASESARWGVVPQVAANGGGLALERTW